MSKTYGQSPVYQEVECGQAGASSRGKLQQAATDELNMRIWHTEETVGKGTTVHKSKRYVLVYSIWALD